MGKVVMHKNFKKRAGMHGWTHTYNCIIPCHAVRYTQQECSARFSCGRSLAATIDDIAAGRHNPLTSDFLSLNVVYLGDVPYSIDNRRLYCLKQAQELMPWRQMFIKARVHNLWDVLHRFLDHFDTHTDGQWIHVRSVSKCLGDLTNYGLT